jgi:hypothetical protein
MANIVPLRPQRNKLVQECPRCGNVAPLFAKGVFSQWAAGLCLKCMILMVSQIMGTLKAFTDPLAKFLVEHKQAEPGKPLPKGEDLYNALKECAVTPPATEPMP